MDEDMEVITLDSSDEESKPPKQVTSPKLSLKRFRAELSPDRKSDESTLDVQNVTKKIKLDLPESTEDASNSKEPQKSFASSSSEEEKNRARFRELLEYATSLMEETSEEEIMKIDSIMFQRLNSTQPSYLSSREFGSLLNTSFDDLKNGKGKTFMFEVIYNVRKQLKKHKYKYQGEALGINDSSNTASSFSSFRNAIASQGVPTSSGNSSLIPDQLKNHSVTLETMEDSVSNNNLINEKTSDSFSHDSLPAPVSKTDKFNSNSFKGSTEGLFKTSSEPVAFQQNSSAGVTLTAEPDNNLYSVDNSTENSSDGDMQIITPEKNSMDEAKENDILSSPIAEALGLIPTALKSLYTSTAKKTVAKRLDFTTISSSFATASDKISSAFSNPVPSSSCQPASSSKSKSSKVNSRNAGRIKKLENMLEQLDKAIKKCQKREMTLDELDSPDSAYIKESQYKRRFNVIWKKLCELQKEPARTGRIIEKKFKYEGSRYKAINEAIQTLINKKKGHDKFPDYSEVLSVVKKVNDNRDLGFNEREVSKEAERVFKDIGEELQTRRLRDAKELFGCYLTDGVADNDDSDPANHNEKLRKTLEENDKKFKESINEIINEYAEKQTKTSKNSEDECHGKDSDDKNSDEEDDDEEGEEEEDEKTKRIVEDDDDLPLTDPATPEENEGTVPECPQPKHAQSNDPSGSLDIMSSTDRDIPEKPENVPFPQTSASSMETLKMSEAKANNNNDSTG